eukprot:489868-Ditylum_brightwellii.AAC.1
MLNQSTGSMCAGSGNTVNYKYYQASMDSSLLLLVRSVADSFQQESLNAAYSSGESIIPLCCRLL